jgi:hypothetical protein
MRPLLNDAAWLVLLPVAAVTCWRSDMYGKTFLAIALSYLVVTDVQIITGRGAWHQWTADLIQVSFLASFLIALVGIFRGRQSTSRECKPDSSAQSVSARLGRILPWTLLAALYRNRNIVLRPLGWTLIIIGFLLIACATRYRFEDFFPIEQRHHAAVTGGKSYTDGDLHVALNAQSYDLISHSKRREAWTMVAAWLMLAGSICLSQSGSRRDNRRSQPTPPVYPEGRGDAPSGSAEA